MNIKKEQGFILIMLFIFLMPINLLLFTGLNEAKEQWQIIRVQEKKFLKKIALEQAREKDNATINKDIQVTRELLLELSCARLPKQIGHGIKIISLKVFFKDKKNHYIQEFIAIPQSSSKICKNIIIFPYTFLGLYTAPS